MRERVSAVLPALSAELRSRSKGASPMLNTPMRQCPQPCTSPPRYTSSDVRAALQSIVANLLDNALRYGGPGCTVQLTLSAGPAPGWSLTVQDDGPGIAPAEQARVFDRFYRGAGQAASGSGLGLAIVRQAALRLGGSVAIGPGLAGRGVGLQLRVPAQT